MNITGKVYTILPAMKGEGRNGPWTRQDFIIETDEQYPKKLCISVWNSKVDIEHLEKGDPVTVEISAESREYNGKWYTDVKASGLIVNKPKEAASGNPPEDLSETPPPEEKPLPFAPDQGAEDDLPF
jgi:hypothetical protein